MMAAFGKGGIGSDSSEKKLYIKIWWKEVESSGLWDAASVSKWFLAVEEARTCWTRWPLQALFSCNSILFSRAAYYLAEYANPVFLQ